MAHTAKELGDQAYLMFLSDLYFSNQQHCSYRVWDFSSALQANHYYLSDVTLQQERMLAIDEQVTIHMRLDPPFNLSYLHALWLLQAWEDRGVKIVNRPSGILHFNEKLSAYSRDNLIPSWVGHNIDDALIFLEQLQEDYIITKPLDLYQGIGVKKLKKSSYLRDELLEIQQKFAGPLVVQPYVAEVEQGEIRTIFFQGEEIGSIVKIPPSGKFLANIAQGATFQQISLDKKISEKCSQIAVEFLKEGIDLIAFDVLAGAISEINITCPGLLVEVSEACGKNLTSIILKNLSRQQDH